MVIHRRPFLFRPSQQVLSRQVGEEVVLVHLQTNRIHGLNRTAARFWELFVQGQVRDEIMRQLLREFDVGREQLETEIEQLLLTLREKQLIIPVESE